MDSVDRIEAAKKLYAAHTNNNPAIHCNRFPSWDELSLKQKVEWIEKTRLPMAGKRDALCRLIEANCPQTVPETGLPIGSQVEILADRILTALTADKARDEALEEAGHALSEIIEERYQWKNAGPFIIADLADRGFTIRSLKGAAK